MDHYLSQRSFQDERRQAFVENYKIRESFVLSSMPERVLSIPEVNHIPSKGETGMFGTHSSAGDHIPGKDIPVNVLRSTGVDENGQQASLARDTSRDTSQSEKVRLSSGIEDTGGEKMERPMTTSSEQVAARKSLDAGQLHALPKLDAPPLRALPKKEGAQKATTTAPTKLNACDT